MKKLIIIVALLYSSAASAQVSPSEMLQQEHQHEMAIMQDYKQRGEAEAMMMNQAYDEEQASALSDHQRSLEQRLNQQQKQIEELQRQQAGY